MKLHFNSEKGVYEGKGRGNNECLFDFAYLRATTVFRHKASFLGKVIVSMSKPMADQTLMLSTHQWRVTECDQP